MLSDSKKISIRQAVFLFLTIVFSPAIRIIPVYSARKANEAAWLAPIVAVIMFVLISLVLNKLYKNYANLSLMQIYSNIIGKFLGKVLVLVHLVWITLLISLYLRYFGIRLVASVYPNTSLSIFLISMLIVVIYVLRYGLVTLARMNEIILPFLVITFTIISFLLLPYIKAEFLTPITYRSIIPVISASVGTTGIMAYFTFFFILGDYINNKERITKIGMQTALYLLISQISLIIITVGTFSHNVIARSQLPFLIAVKQISLFNTLEKIDSVVVALWVVSDFVLISFFILLALRLMRSLFKLSDEKPLMNIFIILIYFLSMYLVNSVFELEKLSNSLIIPGNIILGFVLPVVILVIGMLRKKV